MLKYLSLSGHFREWWQSLPLKQKRIWAGALTFLVVGGISLLPFNRIGVTTTASMKKRVYWISYDTKDLKKNDIVMFEGSNIATNFKVSKITKQIRCMEDEFLEIKGHKEYYCNGEYLGRAKDMSLKKVPVKNFIFTGYIPKGKLFVMGNHVDSYDSRYMGFVEKNKIVAKEIPIF